jgi:hypothetical protein
MLFDLPKYIAVVAVFYPLIAGAQQAAPVCPRR